MRAAPVFCLILLIVLGDCACPHKWIQFRNHCYFVSSNGDSDWTQATVFCRIHGGYLANIDDITEDYFLRGLAASSNGYCVAVGATDAHHEGTWVSVLTGKPITYVGEWGSGEPNGGKLENCLCLHRELRYKWNDKPCDHKDYYICEKNA